MASTEIFSHLSEEDKKVLAMAQKDLIAFGKLFSPQDFLASTTPDFHVEVGKLLLDRNVQQIGLVLPRDHAKSTLTSTLVFSSSGHNRFNLTFSPTDFPRIFKKIYSTSNEGNIQGSTS